MEVYILRHGIAEEGGPGKPDSDRALTAEGRRQLRAILKQAEIAGVSPDLIITSPYRRAVETAEEAAKALGYKGDLLRTKSLVPGSTPHSVWEEIRLHRDARQILLSGHEPLASMAAAFLLGCADLEIEFKKGSMARIDLDRFGAEPRGSLRWLLAPKLAGARKA